MADTITPLPTIKDDAPSPRRSSSLLDNIFERSLNCNPYQSLPPSRRNSKCLGRAGRSMSIVSIGSTASNCLVSPLYSAEDYVAPVLDTTAELLTDPDVDYNNVTVVYCDCDDAQCSRKTCCARPAGRERKRTSSRSYILVALMSALDSKQPEEAAPPEAVQSLRGADDADGQTVKFYLFADVINGEHALERFNSATMSEFIGDASHQT